MVQPTRGCLKSARCRRSSRSATRHPGRHDLRLLVRKSPAGYAASVGARLTAAIPC
jgi:hypothetical protein